MNTTPTRCGTLPQLRRAVRALACEQALPADLRARLLLSITAVARPTLHGGQHVTVDGALERGEEDQAAQLVVTLRAPRPLEVAATTELPLPAETAGDGTAVWRVPVSEPAGDAREDGATGPHTDAEATEEELRAVLARADEVAAEHHRLKDELAETNRGVLALYVQLEERDEQLRKAHGKILRELEDALRPAPIEVDGLELAVHYAPADPDVPTGGDLYDWFALPDGTVHITIVDALGHGVRSTRSALNVTHAVRTLALEGHPLRSIVARTDEIMHPLDQQVMATVLLARIDPASGEVQLANGSHPPALVVRADGSAEFLEVPGRGIGFPLPGSERLRTERLGRDDLLVLYTDGLTESRRDPLEGESRLIDAVRKHARSPIEQIPGAIARDMHTVVLHPDDTLALTVRLTPASP